MQEDDPVCLQSKFLWDARPQTLQSLSSGDSKLHGAAGGGGDEQTHRGLTGLDPSPTACSLGRGEQATETPLLLLLLLHSDTLSGKHPD